MTPDYRFAPLDAELFLCADECDQLALVLDEQASDAGKSARDLDRWGLSLDMAETQQEAIELRIASLKFQARSTALRSVARDYSDMR